MNKTSEVRAQTRSDATDNPDEHPIDKHPEDTSMLRRTVIFLAITVGLPILTAIAIAWAK